ncbi:hypothetical protein UCRPA7_7260 [Phaeoacremonium minimum UCRPA7]|uniref:Uncharacterized protein n=1 Tax=Phaeoacremonium minimum (strain UCR-PA7) TaxID=1286976 RepID=R8BD48_PHAM7|nr:hypothetical protein UCRPA7_7260 [Phaeoacremonium minimum UCRPA7]EON97234.1 hypothetical protein UCRPA7_7260 [Phaeoacremonium minimum UCRPA7]
MKAYYFVLAGLAALAATSPVTPRQCAGCEPSAKGSTTTDAAATNNNTNSNGNSNDISLNVSGASSPGGSAGGNGTPTDGEGEVKGSCKACIDFCTGRGDAIDGICKAIVCGVDCILI